ncbi:MAG: hypothetical protein ACHP7K_12010 [Actinomycetales bacterium]|jgi:hypothetical protein
MGFDQYHEPAAELSPEIRTYARMCANLTEEAEAIGWYQQRISLEPDADSRAIMEDALGEEFKHFCMDLEFLLRATPLWRETAQGILLRDGDIVANAEAAEASAAGVSAPQPQDASLGSPPGAAPGPPAAAAAGSSLGIGSLRGGDL